MNAITDKFAGSQSSADSALSDTVEPTEDDAPGELPESEIPESEPAVSSAPDPTENSNDELFCCTIPMEQAKQIEAPGNCVAAMIEFPEFSIYHSFSSPDELVPEHMLMAIWKQEKLAKGSGTSAVGVDETEERIYNMFGIEAFFGDYPSGPVGMDLPIV